MVMVLPGSALPGPPSTVSVLSLVMRSPAVPVSWETEPTVGAAGAVVSIVQVLTPVGCDSLPAGSVAVIESGCWPSASTLVLTL